MPQGTLVITPIQPLVNLDQLIGTTVQAKPMDDPCFKHETYIGTIDEVKINKWGTFVHFDTPNLVGKKWIKLEKVIGWAHYAPIEEVVQPAMVAGIEKTAA